MQKNHSIYLAGPWFTQEQLEVQAQIETYCIQLQRKFFSPRIECLCPPNATNEQRVKSFSMNVEGVKNCRIVLANIEGLDTGTIWEMGAAYAFGTPVIAYSLNSSRKLNLMLAQSCEGFLAGMEVVQIFLRGQPSKLSLDWINECDRPFNWEVVQKWNQPIV